MVVLRNVCWLKAEEGWLDMLRTSEMAGYWLRALASTVVLNGDWKGGGDAACKCWIAGMS
jgi:hypothetical protein